MQSGCADLYDFWRSVVGEASGTSVRSGYDPQVRRKYEPRKEFDDLLLFIWRATGPTSREHPVNLHAHPEAYRVIAHSLEELRDNFPNGGTRKFRGRKTVSGTDMARIAEALDGRAQKPSRTPAPRTPPKLPLLDVLVVKLDPDAADDGRVVIEDAQVMLRLNRGRLDELIDACRGQAGPWGNDGAFGAGLACGIWFAPDWLGVE